MGMNLGGSTKKKEVESYSLRSERLSDEESSQIKKERSKPYNRTFQPKLDSDVIGGRAERREQHKQARYQVGFISWVVGVFSGLIVVIFAWGILGGFTKTDWEDPVETMIIEKSSDVIVQDENDDGDIADSETEDIKEIDLDMSNYED